MESIELKYEWKEICMGSSQQIKSTDNKSNQRMTRKKIRWMYLLTFNTEPRHRSWAKMTSIYPQRLQKMSIFVNFFFLRSLLSNMWVNLSVCRWMFPGQRRVCVWEWNYIYLPINWFGELFYLFGRNNKLTVELESRGEKISAILRNGERKEGKHWKCVWNANLIVCS